MSKAIIVTYTGLVASDLVKQNIISAMYSVVIKGTTVDITTLNDEELTKAVVKVAVKPIVKKVVKQVNKYDAAANVLYEMLPVNDTSDVITFRRKCILKMYEAIDKTIKSEEDKAFISAIKIVAETEDFNGKLSDPTKMLNILIVLEIKSIANHFKI